jgi:hypothetical protein
LIPNLGENLYFEDLATGTLDIAGENGQIAEGKNNEISFFHAFQ